MSYKEMDFFVCESIFASLIMNTKHESGYLHRLIEWFYLTSETDSNNYCEIATSKQTKTMELVHNNGMRSTLLPISRVK